MAKVFLDVNKVIDLVENRKEIAPESLDGHDLFISALSMHIFFYVTKQRVPYKRLEEVIQDFSIVDLDQTICYKSFVDPTNDFEDNVQLHCAANADCDVFLTSDKKLLNMKFFGKTRILQALAS